MVSPVGITDPTPVFSWEYGDAGDAAQTAYHVIVASSKENLDAQVGDVWDSGVVESSEKSAVFEGDALASRSVYHWRVRVRNAEGVWSEAW